jgi:hypothetical protein
LWLILFILITSGFFYLIFKLIIQFFNYSVSTNTDTLRDFTTPFPTVTLCDYNIFSTPEGTAFVKEYSINSDEMYKKSNMSDQDLKIKKIQSEIKYAKSFLLRNKTIYNNTELRKKFSLTLDKMMVSCYFGSKICSENDFEYFFDISFGNCYRFNSGISSSNQSIPLKKVISSGDNSGFQLEIYLGSQDANSSLTYLNGLYLAIHNNSFRGLLPNNGLNIPAGRTTLIGNCIYFIYLFFLRK